MIKPIPFSIQMPTMHSTQAAIRMEPRSRAFGHEEQNGANQVARDGRPDPRDQPVVTVTAKEQIVCRSAVRTAGVEQRKNFTGQHHKVDRSSPRG